VTNPDMDDPRSPIVYHFNTSVNVNDDGTVDLLIAELDPAHISEIFAPPFDQGLLEIVFRAAAAKANGQGL
jgi:hypothetical protein